MADALQIVFNLKFREGFWRFTLMMLHKYGSHSKAEPNANTMHDRRVKLSELALKLLLYWWFNALFVL